MGGSILTVLDKINPFNFLNQKKLLAKSVACNFPYVQPSILSIDLTSRCNSHCSYCNKWQTGNQSPQELTMADIRKLYIQAKKMGVSQASLSGGEPLLRGDLEEIIVLMSKGMKVTLTTNGMLLTPARVDSLVNAGLQVLVLSVDSLDSPIYQKLRGVSFDVAEKALAALVYGKGKYRKFYPSINCVISKYNVGQLERFAREFFKQYPGLGMINFQAYDGSWTGNRELIPAKEQEAVLVREIDNLVTMKQAGFMISNSIEYLKSIPDFLYRVQAFTKSPCSSGFTSICVSASMALHPCYLFPAIADLRQEDLAEIWYSAKMKIERGKMIRGECPGCSSLLHKPDAIKVENGFF
jgi:MoaA/NifB/PqqE/SkfB family radical SAM enzyme